MGTLFAETAHRDFDETTHRDTEAPPPLGASVCRGAGCRCKWLVVAIVIGWLSPLGAQQLLDRVVARVAGYAITLTDAHAALALGVVDVPQGPTQDAEATQRLIDRQLVLAEVARFAPPEPDMTAVDREMETMKERAGAGLDALMQSTGLDEARLRDIARDTLRIQAYLNQRFGTTVQVSDEEVALYYRNRAGEFQRGGMLIPFDEAEPIARQRAAAARRGATIVQWMSDLRQRVEVIEPGSSRQ